MQEQQPCTRGDLEAVYSRDIHFTVDDSGELSDFLRDGDVDEAKCYYCANCRACFVPDDADYPGDWDRAWQAALDHLPKPDPMEVAAMSCCLPSTRSRAASSKGTRNEPS